MSTKAENIRALQERVDGLGARVVELEEKLEVYESSRGAWGQGLANVIERLNLIEGPDDRKEVRQLRIDYLRLETMVRGIVAREQDHTLGKPVNPGSVSIHAGDLSKHLVESALEEREAIATYLERRAELHPGAIANAVRELAKQIRQARHL